MSFSEIAALTLHDVKNRLAQLAGRAEAAGDVETMRDAIAAADALTRLLVYYRAEIGSLGLNIDAHAPADLAAELLDGATEQVVRERARRRLALHVAIDAVRLEDADQDRK